MKATFTQDISADAETTPIVVEGSRRLAVRITVADGTDAAGVFSLRTAAEAGGDRDAHPNYSTAKTAGNGLVARWDLTRRCGYDVTVRYVRSAGGAAQTALVEIQTD